jgi:hypothetical protein
MRPAPGATNFKSRYISVYTARKYAIQPAKSVNAGDRPTAADRRRKVVIRITSQLDLVPSISGMLQASWWAEWLSNQEISDVDGE